MIGKGRLAQLTTDLARGRCPRAAQRFSDRLHRRIGCRLAWHRGRRVHVVYRSRGNHVAPQTYFDLGLDDPLFSADLLDLAVDAVRWAEAKMNRDWEVMLDVYNRRQAERAQADTRAYVDERLPDFMADLVRADRLFRFGPRSQRVFPVRVA
jgi:hypothetical protein